MRDFIKIGFVLVLSILMGCSKDEETQTTLVDPDPEGSVNVTLTLASSETLAFSMNDAELSFLCGLEGGSEFGYWAIRGTEITDGNETLDIRWLNIVMDDISNLSPPYSYSGEPQTGEGFNRVMRNGVEYIITAVTYTIESYTVIEPDFNSYLAEASGSYTIEIESPSGEQESILIEFSPILQTDYGGGC